MRDGLSDLPGGLLGAFGAGEDEWDQGFVDKHTVRLIDEGNICRRLHRLVAGGDLVVAQVVEANLRHRGIDDVATVGSDALFACRRLRHRSHRQPEKLHERAHPLRITGGKVVVHRDQVDALSL